MARKQFVRSGPRRLTSWLSLQPVTATMTGIGGTIFFVLTAGEKALRPFTIVRTYLAIHVRSDQTAAGEDQFGAVGVAVVSDQSSVVGVTAVPTPATDAGSELWLAHKWFMAAGSSVNDGRVGSFFELDSKAMRKVEDGQDLLVIGEFDTLGDGFFLTIAGRILIKNH